MQAAASAEAENGKQQQGTNEAKSAYFRSIARHRSIRISADPVRIRVISSSVQFGLYYKYRELGFQVDIFSWGRFLWSIMLSWLLAVVSKLGEFFRARMRICASLQRQLCLPAKADLASARASWLFSLLRGYQFPYLSRIKISITTYNRSSVSQSPYWSLKPKRVAIFSYMSPLSLQVKISSSTSLLLLWVGGKCVNVSPTCVKPKGEIIAAKDLKTQTNARLLASVYFKSSINRYWRQRRDSLGISNEEKPHLRKKLLELIREENLQTMPQIGIFAIISEAWVSANKKQSTLKHKRGFNFALFKYQICKDWAFEENISISLFEASKCNSFTVWKPNCCPFLYTAMKF
eukprot:Gb_10010 [translate_table: standard]